MEKGLLFFCVVFVFVFVLVGVFCNDKCGDIIKIESFGYFIFFGYFYFYYLSEKCEWLIQVLDLYQRIMINFNFYFDLEDRDCKYDYVEVFDGENENGCLWGKFCGKIVFFFVVFLG